MVISVPWSIADGPAPAGQKTVVQSFFMLTTVQPSGVGSLERLLGAGGVVELALGVVVEDEQPQGRPVGVLGELEHRDVAVGVAGGEQRPAAGAAPDAHRLLGPVVEVVGRRRVGDRAAALVAGVGAASALLPITRSRGMPYTSWLIGRMKSRPPPETM